MKSLRFAVPLALVAAALIVSATALGGSPKPSVQFKSASQSVTEGGGASGINVNIPVTISPKSAPGSVTFTTQGGTATSGSDCTTTPTTTDYVANTGQTLTFTAHGPTTLYAVVHICDNSPYEGPETVGLHLSSPSGVTLGSKKDATLTINDNDPKPTIDIANAGDVPEGGTSNFGVSLTGAHEVPVSVHYSTVDGTAAAPGDYVSQSGTLTWAAGDNAGKLVSVTTNTDTIDEPTESYTVQLSSPSNGTVGTGTGTGNILDQNDPPKFSVSNASANEGNPPTGNTLTFNVSLSGPTAQDATVHWENSATGAHPATEGASCTGLADYVAGSGTLTFHPGDPLTQQVTINTCPDLDLENNETFSIALSSPTYASIDGSGNPGIGTIFNDDGCTTSFEQSSPGDTATSGPGFTITPGGSSGDVVDTIAASGPNSWSHWAGDVGKHVLEINGSGPFVTLTFDQLQKSVNITAALSVTGSPESLEMDAMDAGNNVIDSNSQTPGDDVQHQYQVGDGVTANIDHVAIYTTFFGIAPGDPFAFRELSFTACPGP